MAPISDMIYHIRKTYYLISFYHLHLLFWKKGSDNIKIGSKELIRDINNNLVLETIIEKFPISRAELSKDLGLTKATISSIVQDLINQSLVIEIGSGKASVGRKPTMLTLNKSAGYSVCVDLSIDKTYFMVTDILGNCIFKTDMEYTNIQKSDIINNLCRLIDDFINTHSQTQYGIIGITIGIHGIVDNNTILFTPYYDISDYDFVKVLGEKYQTPVYLYNEANLSVLGENTFSTHVENIASIIVNSGIGLGLVLNKKLYTGCNGYAGEFGHTIIELDGRSCPCGNKGCLEQYGSQRALLCDLANMKNVDKVTIEEFTQWYREKDVCAIQIANRFVEIMAAGINNILNLYNPEVIILNTYITRTFPSLLDEIKKQLHSKAIFEHQICLSTMAHEAILYGATYINIVGFLKIRNFNPKHFDYRKQT